MVISWASGSRPAPLSAPVSRPEAGSSTTTPRRRNVATFDGGRVQPHLGVHRRRTQHRASRGEQGRGQQIVGAAVYGPGQQIGGGRRYYDQISLLAEVDMRNRGNVLENAGAHRMAGERLEVAAPTKRNAASVGMTWTS